MQLQPPPTRSLPYKQCCFAGGVEAPTQNGAGLKVGKSPDTAGGQLTPSPNLQNPDVSPASVTS